MSASTTPPAEAPVEADLDAGLTHVTTASFLASRLAPSAGFWIALAGGVALAKTAATRGARHAYGASLAATLQTIAMMGPLRLSIPLTQAISAPWMGHLEGKGSSRVKQFAVAAGVRIVHGAIGTAFFIWVITGGVDAFAGTYNTFLSFIPFVPDLEGPTVALTLTFGSLVAWSIFASCVQVGVYRRALRTWGEGAEGVEPREHAEPPVSVGRRRFDPRAVALAAVLASIVLLCSTQPIVLGAVALWLGIAWSTCRGDEDREIIRAGLIFAALLAFAAWFAVMVAGLGTGLAFRRGARAALLVLIATWLRVAAGTDGLREVARRALGRVSRLPATPEAAAALDRLGDGRQLVPAGKELMEVLEPVELKPLPVVDVVNGWVACEAARFRPAPEQARKLLRLRTADALLILLVIGSAASLSTHL